MAKLKRPSSDTALGLTIGLPTVLGIAGMPLGYKWRVSARDKEYIKELAEAEAKGAVRINKRSRGPGKGKNMWDMTAKDLAYPFPEDLEEPYGKVVLQHTKPFFWQDPHSVWKESMDANEAKIRKWSAIASRNQDIAEKANQLIEDYNPTFGQGKKYMEAVNEAVNAYEPLRPSFKATPVNITNPGSIGAYKLLHGFLPPKTMLRPGGDQNNPSDFAPLGYTVGEYPENDPYSRLLPQEIKFEGPYRQSTFSPMAADGGAVPRYENGGTQQDAYNYSGNEVPSYARGGASGPIDRFYDNFGGNFLGRRIRKGETEAIGAVLGLPGYREEYQAKYGKPWNYALHEMLQGSFTPEINDYLAEKTEDAMRFANSNNNLRNWMLNSGDKTRSWFDQRSQIGSPLGYLGHRMGNYLDQWAQNLAPDQDAYPDPTANHEYTYRAPADRTNYYEYAGGIPQDEVPADASLWDRIKIYAKNFYNKIHHIGDPDAFGNPTLDYTFENPLHTKAINDWTEVDLNEAVQQGILPDPEKDKKGFTHQLKVLQSIANTVEGKSLGAVMGIATDKTKNREQVQDALKINRNQVANRLKASGISDPTDDQIDEAIQAQIAVAMTKRAPTEQPHSKYDAKGNLYINKDHDAPALGTLKDINIKKGKLLTPPKTVEDLPPITEPPKMTWAMVPGETVQLTDGREVPKVVRVPVPPPAPRYNHQIAMDWFNKFNQPDEHGVQGTEYDPATGQLKPHQKIQLDADDYAEGSDVFSRDFGATTIPDPDNPSKTITLGNPDIPDNEYGNRFYRYDARTLGPINPKYDPKETEFRHGRLYNVKRALLPATYAEYEASKPHLPKSLIGGYIEPFKIPERPTNLKLPAGFGYRAINGTYTPSGSGSGPISIDQFVSRVDAGHTDPNDPSRQTSGVGEIYNVPKSRIKDLFHLNAVPQQDIADSSSPMEMFSRYIQNIPPYKSPTKPGVIRTNPLFTRPNKQAWMASNPNKPGAGQSINSPYWTDKNNQDLVNPFPAKPGVVPPFPNYFDADVNNPQAKAARTFLDKKRGLYGDPGAYLTSPDFVKPKEGWPGYNVIPEEQRLHGDIPIYSPDAYPRFPEHASDADIVERYKALQIDQDAPEKYRQELEAKAAAEEAARQLALANKPAPHIPDTYGPGKPTDFNNYGTVFGSNLDVARNVGAQQFNQMFQQGQISPYGQVSYGTAIGLSPKFSTVNPTGSSFSVAPSVLPPPSTPPGRQGIPTTQPKQIASPYQQIPAPAPKQQIPQQQKTVTFNQLTQQQAPQAPKLSTSTQSVNISPTQQQVVQQVPTQLKQVAPPHIVPNLNQQGAPIQQTQQQAPAPKQQLPNVPPPKSSGSGIGNPISIQQAAQIIAQAQQNQQNPNIPPPSVNQQGAPQKTITQQQQTQQNIANAAQQIALQKAAAPKQQAPMVKGAIPQIPPQQKGQIPMAPPQIPQIPPQPTPRPNPPRPSGPPPQIPSGPMPRPSGPPPGYVSTPQGFVPAPKGQTPMRAPGPGPGSGIQAPPLSSAQQYAPGPPPQLFNTPGGNPLPFSNPGYVPSYPPGMGPQPTSGSAPFSDGGQVRRFDVGGVVPKYEQLPSYEYGGYSDMIGRQLLNEAIPRYDAGGMIPQMPFQQQFAKMEAGQLGSVKEAFNRAITDPRTGRLIDPMTGQEIDSGYYQRQVMESYMNQHAYPQALPSGVVDPTGTMPGGAQVAQQDATYVAPQIKARIPYYQAMYQKSAAKAANPKGAMKNIVPLKTRV
jgi:hypothetical protein